MTELLDAQAPADAASDGPFASPADTGVFGEYSIRREPGDERPVYRFDGRITADGSSGFRAEPGRYHLYSGWFCPWAQRVTIVRELAGLQDVVSVSYVDGQRDARGWAFRRRHGVDPVNGFTLLRDAYDATEPGFDGHISVPTLWDRETGTVVSNRFEHIGIDLATQFGAFATPVIETYPADLAGEIEALDRWIGPAVNWGVYAAGTDDAARERLLAALADLDERLAASRFLLGGRLTEADVRLWVTLVRYDLTANAGGRIGPALSTHRNLWGWARDLYSLPAFRDTTDFSAFGALAEWDHPTWREGLSPA